MTLSVRYKRIGIGIGMQQSPRIGIGIGDIGIVISEISRLFQVINVEL